MEGVRGSKPPRRGHRPHRHARHGALGRRGDGHHDRAHPSHGDPRRPRPRSRRRTGPARSTARSAVERAQGDLEVFVNISQMTVSQMSLTRMTDSPQHRQHWLAEQALNWSGLPIVHLRPTVFLDNPFFSVWAAESIARDGTLRLPFGSGQTSPIAARDVAEVAATVLASPAAHIGAVHELTGPRSQDMHALAAELSDALGRTVTYVDVPFEQWRDQELRGRNLPRHVFEHISTMARLHAANRYDRHTDEVQTITGRPASGMREFVAQHPELFEPLKQL